MVLGLAALACLEGEGMALAWFRLEVGLGGFGLGQERDIVKGE